jgi:hypothetical protein
MSKFVYKDARLFVDGYDLSGLTNEVSINYKSEVQDCTRMDQPFRKRIGGLKDCDMSSNTYFDNSCLDAGLTDELVDETLFDDVGVADIPITFLPDGDTAADTAFFFRSIRSSMGYNGTVGNLYSIAHSSSASDGEMNRGKLISDVSAATSTSTTSGITDIAISNDWQLGDSGSANAYNDVTYGNGTFVAVGNSLVMTSCDGINWTQRVAAAANGWRAVTYGNGKFVAVANSGVGNRVMTSVDGVTWATQTSASDVEWYDVKYANSLFVAVSLSGGPNSIMTSPDGITWTMRVAADAAAFYSITYGAGLFVAVGEGICNTSPDGITWTTRVIENNGWFGVTYNGTNLFVAVAYDGTNRVSTSPDGITWTPRTAASQLQWHGVEWGNGVFIAVANSGTDDRIMSSPDGITWTTRVPPSNSAWVELVYGGGKFLAVASTAVVGNVMSFGGRTIKAALHVYGAEGVSPTLDVVLQQAVENTFIAPSTVITFTQATDVTSEYSEYTTIQQFTDDYFRLSYTIGGTSPEFDFVVVISLQ